MHFRDVAVKEYVVRLSMEEQLATGQIGIGGRLTTPPLPHHRTYGSVYGGSVNCAVY
jgi:hypothetical protein